MDLDNAYRWQLRSDALGSLRRATPNLGRMMAGQWRLGFSIAWVWLVGEWHRHDVWRRGWHVARLIQMAVCVPIMDTIRSAQLSGAAFRIADDR